jgi:hypothetical protein
MATWREHQNRTGRDEMRPGETDQSEFTSNALAKSFRYAPTDGVLAEWIVDGTYEVDAGRLRVTSLTIHAAENSVAPKGITGTVLRSIYPARFTDRLKASEGRYLQWLVDGLGDTEAEVADRYPDSVQAIEKLIEQARDMVEAPRSGPTGLRGAPRIDDDFLRNIVRMHIKQIEDDRTYGSTKRLAKELGKPYNTVKDWIAKARKRGLYPPDGPIANRDRE